jgi:hypothetical protein
VDCQWGVAVGSGTGPAKGPSVGGTTLIGPVWSVESLAPAHFDRHFCSAYQYSPACLFFALGRVLSGVLHISPFMVM